MPAGDEAPDKLFEKRWARATLNRVLERLGEESHAAGDGHRFQRLAPFLTGRGESYKSVAAELEMSESTVGRRVARAVTAIQRTLQGKGD